MPFFKVGKFLRFKWSEIELDGREQESSLMVGPPGLEPGTYRL